MAETSTGWKNPLAVSQDDRRVVNDNHACYTWADLTDILKDNNHYAYIPTSGGIDSLRASPVIYAYNYNFQIPLTATIKKVSVLPIVQQTNGTGYGKVSYIKTLKLKVGSSLTDYGTGKNLADTEYVKTTKLPLKEWSTEKTWTNNEKYVFEGDGTTWGTTLSPTVVNSTNFGCVFQVVGTALKKWVNPGVARLMMKIDYETSEKDENKIENQESKVTTTYSINNEEVTFSGGFSKKLYTGLNVDTPDSGVTIKISHKHTGQSASSPIIVVSSPDIPITSQKNKSYTLPTISMGNDEKVKEYTQEFTVYPGFMGGYHNIQIQSPSSSVIIRFDVTGAAYTDMGDVEKEKYQYDGQFCKITNCTFNKNTVTAQDRSHGGAMYVLTEHFTYKGNKYGTGDNKNTMKVSDSSATDGYKLVTSNLCYNDEDVE